jgi:hypothetical protein
VECKIIDNFWSVVETKNIVDDSVETIVIKYTKTIKNGITQTQTIPVRRDDNGIITASRIVKAIQVFFDHWVKHVESIIHLGYDYFDQQPSFAVHDLRVASFVKDIVIISADLDYFSCDDRRNREWL